MLIWLTRTDWGSLHISIAVLFIAMGFTHLSCNWRGLLHHRRDRKSWHLTLKLEAVLALLVTVAIFTGAVLSLPPLSQLHDLMLISANVLAGITSEESSKAEAVGGQFEFSPD